MDPASFSSGLQIALTRECAARKRFGSPIAAAISRKRIGKILAAAIRFSRRVGVRAHTTEYLETTHRIAATCNFSDHHS
jgi:hypothetical protein